MVPKMSLWRCAQQRCYCALCTRCTLKLNACIMHDPSAIAQLLQCTGAREGREKRTMWIRSSNQPRMHACIPFIM